MSKQQPIKIACFAGADPRDIQLWSGTPYYALEALEKHIDIAYIERRPFPEWFNKLAKIIKVTSREKIDIRMIPICVRLASIGSRRRLERCGADAYVSFAASGIASMLDPRLKQVLVSDATSIAIAAYYPNLQNLWGVCRTGYEAMEREAMRRARVLTYPSHWAQQSALSDFGNAPDKVAVVPWGPNGQLPVRTEPRTCVSGEVRLLFVGIDWKRKGGEIALETAKRLRARGVACRLDVVGVDSSVVKDSLPDYVTFHGRLNKAVPAELALLHELFDSAHLFLLPTKAEALGMVFAEAAAVGLPSISFATGGVTTVVQGGETGLLLPPGSSADDFAAAIEELVSDASKYEEFSRNGISDSQNRLNWDVWARTIIEICEQL